MGDEVRLEDQEMGPKQPTDKIDLQALNGQNSTTSEQS